MSAVKLDSNLKYTSEWKNILVNPGMPIPKEATEVHNITDDMVKEAMPFAAYAKGIHEFFSGCILCGYNIKNFDVPLLSEEFSRCGINWPDADVKIIDAYKIFAIKERRDLTYAVKFYTGETLGGAHDAEVDVDATINVFAAQMRVYPDLKAMSVDELQRFCDEGVTNVDLAGKIVLNGQGVAVYSFGKSKGVPVTSDKGFGEWMLKNDFPENTKAIVRSLIYKTN
jgi:DNA polymerase-3 subunit epsilon